MGEKHKCQIIHLIIIIFKLPTLVLYGFNKACHLSAGVKFPASQSCSPVPEKHQEYWGPRVLLDVPGVGRSA